MNWNEDISKTSPAILKATRAYLVKMNGSDVTDSEVEKAADFMRFMANLGIDQYIESEKHADLLQEHPDGCYFPFEGRKCVLCGEDAFAENSWYDKFGLKCKLCQEAIDQKIIPEDMVIDNDLYYTSVDLKHYFNLDRTALKRWIEKGILKPRIVKGIKSRPIHLQVFLLNDHDNLLPPRSMLNFGLPVVTIENGKEWTHTAKWYQSCDPFEYLKDYRIMEYFKIAD